LTSAAPETILPVVSELTQTSCVPCKGGVPPMTDAEVTKLAPAVPEWRRVVRDGIARIEREYAFEDFRHALDFAVAVGELAEREQHHPDLHVSWGKVRVETWTHKIKGLHRNDFILAAKSDQLYAAAATT
jgi:4a-hydroxytetrahydrobiopterin dehydratase